MSDIRNPHARRGPLPRRPDGRASWMQTGSEGWPETATLLPPPVPPAWSEAAPSDIESPRPEPPLAFPQGFGSTPSEPPFPQLSPTERVPVPSQQFSLGGWLASVFRRDLAWMTLALVGFAGLGWGGYHLLESGTTLKGRVMGISVSGVRELEAGVESLKREDFAASARSFARAAELFETASGDLSEWNGFLVELARFIPGASQVSSGKYAIEAGKHLALAGQEVNTLLLMFGPLDQSLREGQVEGLSLLNIFKAAEERGGTTLEHLEAAQAALAKVNVDDLPSDKQAAFIELKRRLPEAITLLSGFMEHGTVLHELLGGNGPRKYLFLFQNNQEMRATGGFIGSYALLDINQGKVRRFFVDGIFNPDGQFKEDIVPPAPLQKVTGGWSLHDSNWWPDFPKSAEKAILFYEKTGGPTVDGVITFTPAVVERLLTVTGPIPMPDYGVTIGADNFLTAVQSEVEDKYDRTKNRPKQILSDLVPELLNRLFAERDLAKVRSLLGILEDSLKEKHALLYARDRSIQDLIEKEGWSGRIADVSGDYLAVINTNINGYKTDGIIDESIEHVSEIREDGSVVDTVTITRRHKGGDSPHEWWNKVNANYLRVYVPRGSRLLSAEGHTRETLLPPLDYQALGFRRDRDVEAEERAQLRDEATGTLVYEDSGKTVFANWTYVSPKETVVIRYSYLLPFKLKAGEDGQLPPYSVYYQKQSGSRGSALASTVSFPAGWAVRWQSRDDLSVSRERVRFIGDLKEDRFYAIVLGR